ncbi:MAG: YraN family protein [Planctomycetota bacterium]
MFDSLRKLIGRPATPGRRGEDAAAGFLKKQGYRVIARNLKDRLGEIDLLCLSPDGNCLVIVEVKSALADAAGPSPELRVGRQKQRKLTALAMRLAQRHRLAGKAIRFDVIGVTLCDQQQPQVRHYIGAFEAAWV